MCVYECDIFVYTFVCRLLACVRLALTGALTGANLSDIVGLLGPAACAKRCRAAANAV